ncbi:hypothetical protein RFI_04647 [Reticulomyxa filosa]|uniref:TLC domain-containing protein n=1 Tax=Reticulomyxa filosa TaxID=46433 RepID=X6P2M8_RETFI|nr:hypothetical protein RFI_04647 [Reticulomyxa filosa]|eukprot:ETO32471.1 hypothetical protein RFI_04647 [Reticulomyxa filosa]
MKYFLYMLNYEIAPLEWRINPDYPFLPVYRIATVIVSAVFWEIFWTTLRSIPRLDDKSATRMTALGHALYASSVSCFAIFIKNPITVLPKSYCANQPMDDVLLCVSLGYFVWDLYKTIVEKWGMDFLIHAIMCIYTYSLIAFCGTFSRIGLIVLFFEFSTIFLQGYILAYSFDYPILAVLLRYFVHFVIWILRYYHM